VAQLTEPAPIIIKGGRAARVGGAIMGIVIGVLLLMMVLSSLSREGSKLTLLLVPGAAVLIGGAVIETSKALKPSRLLVDAQGITFEDPFTRKRWTWDSYHGAMSNRLAVTRYRVFVIAVKATPHRLRYVTIGPFPANLAETLRDYAASRGPARSSVLT
jgi:hypothetical protein